MASNLNPADATPVNTRQTPRLGAMDSSELKQKHRSYPSQPSGLDRGPSAVLSKPKKQKLPKDTDPDERPKKRLKTAKIVDRNTITDDVNEKKDNEAARRKLEAMLAAQFGEDPFEDLQADYGASFQTGELDGGAKKMTKRENRKQRDLLASRVEIEDTVELSDQELRDDIDLGGFDEDGFDIEVGSSSNEESEEEEVEVDLKAVREKLKPKVEVVEFRETGTRGQGNTGSDIKAFMVGSIRFY